MTNPPQQSGANDDLARKLREICIQMETAADEAFFFRQLYLLIASIFGKIEDIFLLWRAGKLPPPPARAPAQRPTAPSCAPIPRHSRTRRHTKRRATRSLGTARPNCARHPAQRGPIPTRPEAPPWRDAPVRRIDRYPKPRKNPSGRHRFRTY